MILPTDPPGAPRDVVIRPYPDVAADAGAGAQIDAIFFEASAVKSFAGPTERAAFHWLWLGRYLAEEPEHAFLAVAHVRGIVGYLVGSLEDPASREAFAGLGYFRTFSSLTARFPAHLHVNVASKVRGQRIGERLVAAFCAHCRAHGISGVHVVTGAGMRNVGFYARLGFREVASMDRHGGKVVMLARQLDDANWSCVP